MLISIINIFFIMTSDNVFYSNLSELLTLTSVKGSKFKQSVNNKYIACTIYKTVNKKTIELPVTQLLNDSEPLQSLNQYFYQHMKTTLMDHYKVFLPIVDTINFKLVIEIDNHQEIINIYYKTGFFAKNKNTIIRIRPDVDGPYQYLLNTTSTDIDDSKHKVVKDLFGLTMDHDFVFDKDGITLIEMLSI